MNQDQHGERHQQQDREADPDLRGGVPQSHRPRRELTVRFCSAMSVVSAMAQSASPNQRGDVDPAALAGIGVTLGWIH